ncbi:MAG: hypothetical protein ACI9K2_006602 [Myxococcota bacterium]|jgi:hypothetical protein
MPEDRDKQWFVKGRIVVDETEVPIPGLVVRVWDKDLMFDDALGTVTTDHDGRFFVKFRTRDFDDGGLETRPDLYLHVHVPGTDRVILSTEDNVRNNAGRMEEYALRLTHWAFNISDGRAFLRFRPQVRGRVIDGSGEPVAGLTVRAHDAADGKVLASTTTDSDGVYGCWYAEPTGRMALKLSVARGVGAPIYRSREPLWFDGETSVVHQVRLP